ncbi:MAG: hypothetical protein Q8900_03850 [Bacillota bacterium]|nr:hypothetical protein [Bacillota bacterium]
MNFKSLLKKLATVLLVVIIFIIFIEIECYAADNNINVVTVLICFILIIIVCCLIYINIKTVNLTKEMQRILKILYEDIDIDRYLREMQNAMTKAKAKTYKFNLSIWLALGYEAKGEYQRAIEYMNNLNIKNAINTTCKAIYYNNLAYFYCEAGEVDEAIKIYLQGEKFINQIIKKPLYRASLLHTKGVLEYLKGNLIESEELLEESKLQTFVRNNLIISANLYLAKIYFQTNRIEKSKLMLNYNISQKLFPNIQTETKKLIETIESTN